MFDDDLEDGRYLECEKNSEFDACRKILHKTLDNAGSKEEEEVKIFEDIYQMDASQAFETYNATALGIPGMRLDLFYPEYDEKKECEEEEEAKEEKVL